MISRHVLTAMCSQVYVSSIGISIAFGVGFFFLFYFVLLFICFVCIISQIQPQPVLFNINLVSPILSLSLFVFFPQ